MKKKKKKKPARYGINEQRAIWNSMHKSSQRVTGAGWMYLRKFKE